MADYQDTRMGFEIPQVPPADQLKDITPEELAKEWNGYVQTMAAHTCAVMVFDAYAKDPNAYREIREADVKSPPELQWHSLRRFHVEQAVNTAEKFVALVKKYVKPESSHYQDLLTTPKWLSDMLKPRIAPQPNLTEMKMNKVPAGANSLKVIDVLMALAMVALGFGLLFAVFAELRGLGIAIPSNTSSGSQLGFGIGVAAWFFAFGGTIAYFKWASWNKIALIISASILVIFISSPNLTPYQEGGRFAIFAFACLFWWGIGALVNFFLKRKRGE